ncbi:hypothetical protein ABK040_003285 [Willaertia magna]
MAELIVMSFLFMITFVVLSTGVFQRDFAFLQNTIECIKHEEEEEKEQYYYISNNVAHQTISIEKEKAFVELPKVKIVTRSVKKPLFNNNELFELKERLNNYTFPPTVLTQQLKEEKCTNESQSPIFSIQPIQITSCC